MPRTIWTNDVNAARAFIESCGGTAAVKSLTTAWWEEPDGASFVYASLLSTRELPQAARLALAPVIFQQAITPKRDLRVTVVEDTVMAAIRPSRTTRTPPADRLASCRATSVGGLRATGAPERCCRKLVSSLSLRFGAIDFVLDQDGQLWFLELNPNGEWGWLQRVGLPIAQALADTLTRSASARG